MVLGANPGVLLDFLDTRKTNTLSKPYEIAGISMVPRHYAEQKHIPAKIQYQMFLVAIGYLPQLLMAAEFYFSQILMASLP